MKGKKKRMAAAVFLAVMMVMSSAAPAFGASVTVNMRTLKGYENYHNILNWGILPDSTLTRFTVNGSAAFCIQSGRVIRDTDGNAFVPGTPNISMDVDYTVETVSGDNSQQSKIAYLGYYGKTTPTDKDYAFTQMMIWQTLPASDQTANGKDGKGAFRSYFNDPAVRKEYDEWKEKIQEKTASWNTYPAFHKKTIGIQAGETLELTDSNRVLEDYGDFSFTQDKVTVSHQKGSNILKVRAGSDCSKASVTMSAQELAAAGAQKYEGTARANYIYKADRSQDMAVYGNVETIPLELSFSVTLKGDLSIKKLSEDGHVENIKFRITGNGVDETVTTDSSGQIKMQGLAPGTYTVTEVETPDRYVPVSSQQVTVMSGQTVSVTFDNILKKGKVVVIKSSEDGFVQGVSFRLHGTSMAGTKVDVTVQTDETGRAVFDDVPISSDDCPYMIEELGTDEKYTVPEGRYVTVLWGQETQARIENVLKRFEIEIIKSDEETGKPLAGAVYGVYKDGELLGEYTSGKDGRVITDPFVCGMGYTVREIKAPDGYVRDETVYQVEGTEPGQHKLRLERISMEFSDKPQKGHIIIKKTGQKLSTIEKKQDGTYRPVFSVQGLEGAVFDVYAAEDVVTADGTVRLRKGEYACRIVTGEDGSGSSTLLYPGRYICREIQSPAGYVRSSREYEAAVVYGGQETAITQTTVEIYNDRQRAEIGLKKEIEGNADFGIFPAETYRKVKFGLFSAERIEAGDGTSIPENGLIEIIGLEQGKDGMFYGRFCTDIPHGRYYVKEMSRGEQYAEDPAVYPADFSYGGSNDRVVSLVLNEGDPIRNDLIKGDIVIRKTDQNGSPLAGAVFGLFLPGEKVLTAENAIVTGTSDKDGRLAFRDVPYGRYILSEISAPGGYEKAGEISVGIVSPGETREYDIVNSRIPMTGDMADLSGWTAVLVLAAVAVMLARGFNLKLEKRADT